MVTVLYNILDLPIGRLKTCLGWNRYRDGNPVPTSPLDDDIATAPSGPVRHEGAIGGWPELFTCLYPP